MLYEKLVATNSNEWNNYTKHRFATQIVTGELKLEKFKHYIAQDYLYLKAYRNCFLHMANNADSQNERDYFIRNVVGDIENDMALMFDVDTNSIESTTVTDNYTNYLYKILVEGSSLEKLVAIAPCVIGYGVLASEINKRQISDDNLYKKWIDIYASIEYQDEVEQYIELLNQYNPEGKELERLNEIFKTVCNLEVKFFDQAIEIRKPIVLTIAGSDSGGGAGIQADIKAISANDCFAASAITAITAQSTTGVYGIEGLSPEIITNQIKVVSDDMDLKAIKIGMLGNVETIETVANALPASVKVVLDPVMVAKDSTKLLVDDAVTCLVENLCPKAYVITPNIEEANVMLNTEIKTIEDMKEASEKLAELCKTNVLLKGGHLTGNQLVDILYYDNHHFEYHTTRIDTINTHGTGCSLSSSLAANLANGLSLEIATEKAINYVQNGIIQNYPIGKGKGPINHFHKNVK